MPDEEKKKKPARKKKATTKKATKKSPAKKSSRKKEEHKKEQSEQVEEVVLTDEKEEEIHEEERSMGSDDAASEESEESPVRKPGVAPVVVGGPIVREGYPAEEFIDARVAASDSVAASASHTEVAAATELAKATKPEVTSTPEPVVSDASDEIIVDNDAEEEVAPVATEVALASPRTHDDYIVPPSQKEKTYRTIFYILCAVGVAYVLYLVFAYGIAKETLRYEYQGDFFSSQVLQSDNGDSAIYVQILDTPTGFLRVRAEANTSADEVGKVFPGETHVVVGEEDEWFEIELDGGETGWIFATYAELLPN